MDESNPMEEQINLKTSRFKFSEIGPLDLSTGTAMFILQNMGKLERKPKTIILRLVANLCRGYLIEHRIQPPLADWSPPPEDA